MNHLHSKYGECPECEIIASMSYEIINKLLNELCNIIGDTCFEALNKFKNGKISKNEFIEIVKREGKAKGISDEEFTELIRRIGGMKK